MPPFIEDRNIQDHFIHIPRKRESAVRSALKRHPARRRSRMAWAYRLIVFGIWRNNWIAIHIERRLLFGLLRRGSLLLRLIRGPASAGILCANREWDGQCKKNQ